MLRLAIAFFVIALIASLFGFGFIENMSFDLARLAFFVFLILAVLSLIGSVLSPPPRDYYY